MAYNGAPNTISSLKTEVAICVCSHRQNGIHGVQSSAEVRRVREKSYQSGDR